MKLALLLVACVLVGPGSSQYQGLRVQLGKFQEVFAWRQLTYNIDGTILTSDQDESVGLSSGSRGRRQAHRDDIDWTKVFENLDLPNQPSSSSNVNGGNRANRQSVPASQPAPVNTNNSTNSDEGRFFIQYNNVPMGVERVGNRVFVTIPRRRYGIPSTLNYIDMNEDGRTRSPHLKPYPDIRQAQELTSVYRTRADSCGRLWMVDTGRLELQNGQRQLRTPAIVVYDLNTNTRILRYELKSSDLPAENTPTGLASITVDITNNDCADAYAYIPDLTTFGLVVYSLRENDSWRHNHNYFSFNPIAGVLMIAGQRFQWSDGVFSIVLVPNPGNCKTAYFHSLIGTHEFSVSTCVLKNRTASSDPNYFSQYSVVGDRGEMTQSTMHGYHEPTNVMFFAEIGRDAVSCWNTAGFLRSSNIAVLARDRSKISYPSDLHVSGDEVWVMANTLPRFGYSRLDVNDHNFFVYMGNAFELVKDTVCSQS